MAAPFVRLRTQFDRGDAASRTVERLASLYEDGERLRGEVRALLGPWAAGGALAGKRVLLKPNWVRHPTRPEHAICLCTHDRFLLAALEVVLEHGPSSVLVADAPVQGCDWGRLVSDELVAACAALGERVGVPVSVEDLRRVTFDPAANDGERERRPMSDFVVFDVGTESYLEPITHPERREFRVTCYDPARLARTHGPGMHKYCIARALFEADVVISLPKVKTHQKAGITAALKNIVGVNGDKDYLPHHRVGGTAQGGDCYEGGSWLRLAAERLLDRANARQGHWSYRVHTKCAGLLWRLSRPAPGQRLSAGWHGNDTTWRMVMDLNTIVLRGRVDGSLAPAPVRRLLSLSDGIVGGQGDGPLDPRPLALGVIGFSDHSPTSDACMARLMGLDPDHLALVRTALADAAEGPASIALDGEPVALAALDALALKAELPIGWEGYDR